MRRYFSLMLINPPLVVNGRLRLIFSYPIGMDRHLVLIEDGIVE